MLSYIALIVLGIAIVIFFMSNDFPFISAGPLVSIYGAIGLVAFFISGAHGIAHLVALILTAPAFFACRWMLTKILDHLDGDFPQLEAKTKNKTGTVSHPIDVMDMGRVTLDVPVDEISEFEAWSSTHMPIGTRVVVTGVMSKKLTVKPLPSTVTK